jgi:hypothetical protein
VVRELPLVRARATSVARATKTAVRTARKPAHKELSEIDA